MNKDMAKNLKHAIEVIDSTIDTSKRTLPFCRTKRWNKALYDLQGLLLASAILKEYGGKYYKKK